MQPLRVGVPTAFDFTDSTPVDLGGISILFITSHDAAFAADALPHVEVESILFAWLELPLRNSRKICPQCDRTMRGLFEVSGAILRGKQKVCVLTFGAF